MPEGSILIETPIVETQSPEFTASLPITDIPLEHSTTSTVDQLSLEGYLSEVLGSLQKQQERQQNEVIQLIVKQQQHPIEPIDAAIQPSKPDHYPQLTTSAWTFTQGFILGQLSVIILFIAFIKFFIFTESPPTQATIPKKMYAPIIKNKKVTTGLSSHSELSSSSSLLDSDRGGIEHDPDSPEYMIHSILEKTYYDVDKHTPESLDWFNVLVAQIIAQIRHEALNNDNIYHSLNDALNSPVVLQYLDKVNITEINIGDDYPIFSNCRVQNNDGRLEAKIDVDVSDTLTLDIETNLLINKPKPLSASLPIKLAVSIVRFSGCLTVSLISADENDNKEENSSTAREDTDPNSPNENNTKPNGGFRKNKKAKHGHSIALMFSFSPDFRLEFEVKSLIGSRAKLENIPRISSIIENVLRKWFIDRCIEPRFQLIKLPSLWPRKKNTRQGSFTDNEP